MWTVLLLLFLLCSGMLAFSLGQHFYFSKGGKVSLPKLDVFSAAFLCLSMVLGGTLLYGSSSNLPIYTWVIVLFLLWGLFYFSQKNWTRLQKNLFCLALCAVGVFGILLSSPQMDFLYWLVGLVLLVCWFLGWRLIVNFDRYPMTSDLVSSGWGVALLIVCFILKSFPIELSLFGGILGISVYVICRKRLSYGYLNLGPYTAEIAGFAWAGVWTLCVAQTNLSILLLAYGYYLMEMCVLLTKHLKKRPSETLLTQALENEKNKKRAISLVFLHVFVLAVLASTLTVIFPNPRLTVSTSLILGIVICLNLYNQLKNLDYPLGSWKDIYSELKKGISALPKASKDFSKEIKTGLRIQKKNKKKVSKKSVSKKKMVKRKAKK